MATAQLVESRSFRPFKSSEEYLIAMREDLAEWLNNLYPELYITSHNFMDRLDTGVAICRHANNVRKYADEYVKRRQAQGKSSAAIASSVLQLPNVRMFPGAKSGTFFARDNVSNFIAWCRGGLGVIECLLFETDDLIMRKNEKHVILCLLEVARRGAKLGMPAPLLVQLEREIDREIAADKRSLQRGLSAADGLGYEGGEEESELSEMSDSEDCSQHGPLPQIITNDLKSLDEMVRDQVEKCRCPTQFPMIRVSEGKYRIGDTKVLIFVRVLRNHVMVRVGGGWDTLSHFLDKHDPCRCKSAHRAPVSAKVVGMRTGGPAIDLSHTEVHYERSPPQTRRSSVSSVGSNNGGLAPTDIKLSHTRSVSPTPSRRVDSLSPRKSQHESRKRSHSPSGQHSRSRSPASSLTMIHPRSNQSRERSVSRNRSTTCNRSRSTTPTPTRNTRVQRDHLGRVVIYDSELLSAAAALQKRSPTPVREPAGTKKLEADEYRERIDSGVESASLPKVSDNFENQARLSISEQVSQFRAPTPVREISSGVDTTPALSVSDNLAIAEPDKPKCGSLDMITENPSHTNNDSGSEVSDEGYRSLGVVTTAASAVPPSSLGNVSPVRVRSRSAGRHDTQSPSPSASPQHSPFRRSAPGNRSARTSQNATTYRPRSNSAYNTWNNTTSKQHPSVSSDNFSQQVADIMQQYAAMMPSPRKDSKPDSSLTTRIPAPVQRS